MLERKDDIPVLASHFIEAACKRFGRSGLRYKESQLRQVQNYDWPGNVRDLQCRAGGNRVSFSLAPLGYPRRRNRVIRAAGRKVSITGDLCITWAGMIKSAVVAEVE